MGIFGPLKKQVKKGKKGSFLDPFLRIKIRANLARKFD